MINEEGQEKCAIDGAQALFSQIIQRGADFPSQEHILNFREVLTGNRIQLKSNFLQDLLLCIRRY